VYSTCLFCHSGLGSNEVIEPFPVGRRLAFDSLRGRLWVICQRCARWNLTPVEERWEAIEECERRFRGTHVRVSTDHIGLAKLREGLELVRIGEPLRPEFAAWRYGDELRLRRRRLITVGGATLGAAIVTPVAGAAAAVAAGAATAVGVVAFGLAIAAAPRILGGGFFDPPWKQMYRVDEDILGERVLTHIPTGQRHAITVRGKHLADAELESRGNGAVPALRVVHDRGESWFEESSALRAAGLLLARANWRGATREQVDAAVRRIGASGDAAHHLSRTAAHAQRFRNRRLMAGWRDLEALNVSFVERLSVEMAVHEETERRALDGELKLLETAWKEAEEIAEIADNLLPPTIDEVRQALDERRKAI
jgi:hypothetical protein